MFSYFRQEPKYRLEAKPKLSIVDHQQNFKNGASSYYEIRPINHETVTIGGRGKCGQTDRQTDRHQGICWLKI